DPKPETPESPRQDREPRLDLSESATRRDREPKIDVTPPAPRKAKPPLLETPGDYAHGFTILFSPQAVMWLAPALLTVCFFLTFFPWLSIEGVSHNLWECAFSRGIVRFILYLILFLLAWLLSLAVVVFSARLAPEPPFLETLGPWRHAIV